MLSAAKHDIQFSKSCLIVLIECNAYTMQWFISNLTRYLSQKSMNSRLFCCCDWFNRILTVIYHLQVIHWLFNSLFHWIFHSTLKSLLNAIINSIEVDVIAVAVHLIEYYCNLSTNSDLKAIQLTIQFNNQYCKCN